MAQEVISISKEAMDSLHFCLESTARYATKHGDDWRPIISKLETFVNTGQPLIEEVARRLGDT